MTTSRTPLQRAAHRLLTLAQIIHDAAERDDLASTDTASALAEADQHLTTLLTAIPPEVRDVADTGFSTVRWRKGR